MEEARGPPASPAREYPALASSDGGLSLVADAPPRSGKAKCGASMEDNSERQSAPRFTGEQSPLHHEDGLLASSYASSSACLLDTPPHPRSLIRPLIWTAAAVLVGVLGVSTFKPALLPQYVAQGSTVLSGGGAHGPPHDAAFPHPLREAQDAPDTAITEVDHQEATSTSTLSLWTQFPDGMDLETAGVQALLESNQNPEDCSSARYLVWANNNYGMGSDLHTMGWALGVAFAQKRVLIYDTNLPWVFTDEKGCPPSAPTPDCFFKPLTRCQGSVTGPEIAASVKYQPWLEPPDADQAKALDSDRVVSLEFKSSPAVRMYVPPPWFTNDPRCTDVWWWRTQSTRFLVRPNAGQVEWAANYFRDNLLRIKADGSRDEAFNATTQAPPQEAICIHVRHGDKGAEMTLHPWEDYMAAAQELVTKQGATPNIFLTTDDAGVIDKVEDGGLAREHGWDFTYYYAKYERHNELNPRDTAESLGQAYFGRVSVANLILAVHPSCRWFVQTTGSNWNRLINEIRLTDGQRKEAAFIDLQPGNWRRTREMQGHSTRRQSREQTGGRASGLMQKLGRARQPRT